MRRALLLALATLLAAPAAACADEAITELPRLGPVAGYAGWEAWSRFDEESARYQLMLREPGGDVREAEALLRRTPFDVQLGPDERGRVVAVFPRCAGPECQLTRLDLASGRGALIRGVDAAAFAERTPAIWRSSLVFTRRVRGCDVPYVKDLRSSATSRRLLFSKCVQTAPGHVSIRGTRIIVSSQVGRGAGVKTSELRRYSARARGSRVMLAQNFGEESNLFGQVAQDERFAWTVRHGMHQANGFVRVGLPDGRVEEAPAFRDLSPAFAKPTPDRSLYVEWQSLPDIDCTGFTAAVPCRLVRSPSVPFAGVVRRLTPELTVRYEGTPRRGQPLVFSGRLLRRSVAGDEVIRTEPLAGVAVDLRHRTGEEPERFEPTGLTAVTGADGSWRIVLPAVGDDPFYAAVAATEPVPTWAGRATVGSVLP
jgi:hypothetical protein